MFHVGEPVVQGTTLSQHFRVGDFIIINPELISGYNHNDYIILKNGRSYDKCIKCGCVVLSIANAEYNQHYNAEPYCMDAELASVVCDDYGGFRYGTIDLRDFVVLPGNQSTVPYKSLSPLYELYQVGIIDKLIRLKYDRLKFDEYNKPIIGNSNIFKASICFFNDIDDFDEVYTDEKFRKYMERFLIESVGLREEVLSVYFGCKLKNDDLNEFEDEYFVQVGSLFSDYNVRNDSVVQGTTNRNV